MRFISIFIYNDETIKERIDKLLSNETVSFTAIQRFANIGYLTAGRMIDEMLTLGLIESEDKEVLIGAKFNFSNKEELEKYLTNKIKYYNSWYITIIWR